MRFEFEPGSWFVWLNLRNARALLPLPRAPWLVAALAELVLQLLATDAAAGQAAALVSGAGAARWALALQEQTVW